MAVDTPRQIADNVAEILIQANLTGHDSHGVLRIPTYLRQIAEGMLNAAAEPKVVQETPNTLIIDGQHGFGHHMARVGMDKAIEKAKAGDLCSVSFRNGLHIGRLGEYAEQATRAGCIGLVSYGLSEGQRRSVVPFGGAKGNLSTNPIAFGAPTGDDTPFVLDIATSVVAEGKLQVARSKDLDMPDGHILNNTGTPTTKTTEFYDGGFLLPFGGHKGYGLSLMTCLLGGLSGTFDPEAGTMRGEFMLAINIERFLPLATYQQGVRGLLNSMKATPPAPGVEEVLVPGDFEQRNRVERLAKGIEVPDTIFDQLQEHAAELKVSMGEEIIEAADQVRY
jgi:LDH2 family malate/lactate/ureidoglycolate dehydrogenase